jgi:hypothetical protein
MCKLLSWKMDLNMKGFTKRPVEVKSIVTYLNTFYCTDIFNMRHII